MTEQVKGPKRGTPEYERVLQEEKLILETTELIYALMEATSTSKSEIAQRLGKTKGFVTQVLNGSRNMTLRTTADFASVLGYRIRISAEPGNAVRNPDLILGKLLSGRQPDGAGQLWKTLLPAATASVTPEEWDRPERIPLETSSSASVAA